MPKRSLGTRDAAGFERSGRRKLTCGRRSLRAKRSALTNATRRNLPDRAWRFGPTATLSGRGDWIFDFGFAILDFAERSAGARCVGTDNATKRKIA